MSIIRGKIIREEEVCVEFSVDELCRENVPYYNFFTFCLMNNLLKPDNNKQKYIPQIDYVILLPSKNNAQNIQTLEMFQKLEIKVKGLA